MKNPIFQLHKRIFPIFIWKLSLQIFYKATSEIYFFMKYIKYKYKMHWNTCQSMLESYNICFNDQIWLLRGKLRFIYILFELQRIWKLHILVISNLYLCLGFFFLVIFYKICIVLKIFNLVKHFCGIFKRNFVHQ